MRRETLLVAAIVAVVVASATVIAAVPDVLQEHERPEPEGHLRVAEVTIKPGAVSGESVTLELTSHLAHKGGRTDNITVVVRATSLETGLRESETETAIDPIEGTREVTVNQSVTVPREGGYRLEVIVYEDGRRAAVERTRVSGVGTLVPEYARTDVAFHRFDVHPTQADALPPLQYRIDSVSDNRTTLSVAAYLTNQGDTPENDLELEIILRQAESNIVADSVRVPVEAIRPGRTAKPTVELTVPDGYNYYIDAILWKDDVVVGSSRSAASLNPTRTISVNRSVREVGIDVGEFAGEDGTGGAGDGPSERDDVAATGTPMEEAGSGVSTPGFGPVVAVAALAAIALFARRYDND